MTPDTMAAQRLALWAGITAATTTTIRNVQNGSGVQLRPFVGAGVVVLGLSAIAVPAPQVAKPLAGLVIIGTLLQSLPTLTGVSKTLGRKSNP